MKKTKILEMLTDSTNQIIQLIEESTNQECSFKKNEDTWSIFEVIEHLILVETGIITNIKTFGEQKMNNKLENLVSHDSILERSVSRELKVVAPEVFRPKGIFENTNDAVTAIQTHRSETALFISTNTLDLSSIAFPHPRFGLFDGNNWLSFIIGHGRRHTEQIKEIKESVQK